MLTSQSFWTINIWTELVFQELQTLLYSFKYSFGIHTYLPVLYDEASLELQTDYFQLTF